MSKKQESLRAELQKILSRGGRTVINKGSDGKAVPVPEEAEVFEFDFTKDGKSYGNVFVSIDGLHQMVVYFSDEVSGSPKNGSTDSESWEQLIKTLKRFAMMKQLSFKLANIDNLENDMAKREHTKRQEKMYEGYHAQGKKASYSDNVPTTKIIIKHKREMQEGEQRFRQIDKIFIENTIGERMLAPTDRPGLARVFARHIAEGGKANDERWNHIGSLCEEYQKMAGFVRATRNGQFNESAQKLVTEGINHYQKLRECLGKMSGQRGYNAYFESYTPALMEDEEQVDLSEMFMSSSLDPRIEGVMPILSKLSRNITETSDMAETIALEEWASEIIGEAPELTKTKPSRQDVAKKMHGILSKSVNKSNMARVKTQQAVGSRVADIGAGGKEYNVKTDAAWDAKEKGLSEDSFDNPVSSAITRRILMQRADLLSKYGPQKVTAAIDDVADFVGDTEEIGSSDVSGWVKQVEQTLERMGGGISENSSEMGSGKGDTYKVTMIDRYGKDAGTIYRNSEHYPLWVMLDEILGFSRTKGQGGLAKFNFYINDKPVDWKKLVAQGLHKPDGGKAERDSDHDRLATGTNEDLDPGQKSAGQFSTKDKFAKPGSLVGANESKINEGVLDTIRNKMKSGSMLDRVRSGAYKKPAAPTAPVAPTAPAAAPPPGYDTETGKPLPPEARFDPNTGKPLPGLSPTVQAAPAPQAAPAATRPPLPSAQAAAQPRPARTVADLTAPQTAPGPTELPPDWKFGMAVPRSVWKAGDDPNKNPNNPIITHMVKVRDALFKRDGTEQPEIQDTITRASRGQAFDPGPFTGWVDESKNVLEGQKDLDAIKRLLGK